MNEVTKLKSKMYVSLPMTGIENNNILMENSAYGIACQMGYFVYRPSKLSKYVEEQIDAPLYRHYLGFDMWALSRCDAMMLCPGWENSKGCITEVRFAIENDIMIYDYMTQEQMDIDAIKKVLYPNIYDNEISDAKNSSAILFMIGIGALILFVLGAGIYTIYNLIF